VRHALPVCRACTEFAAHNTAYLTVVRADCEIR